MPPGQASPTEEISRVIEAVAFRAGTGVPHRLSGQASGAVPA
jgi:hypothetical protein